jgi:hypothetical protein
MRIYTFRGSSCLLTEFSVRAHVYMRVLKKAPVRKRSLKKNLKKKYIEFKNVGKYSIFVNFCIIIRKYTDFH